MWQTFQNPRPSHSPTSRYHKPVPASFKEKFKIYSASPIKPKQPPTSEEIRRQPVKAYTLRLNVKYRSGATSLSPLKMRENRDLTLVNTGSQNNITRLKEREITMLPITKEIENEFDEEYYDFTGNKSGRLTTGRSRGRLSKVATSLKDLIQETGIRNLSTKSAGVNGHKIVETPTGLQVTVKGDYVGFDLKKSNAPAFSYVYDKDDINVVTEEERYKRSVADCMHKYASSGALENIESIKVENTLLKRRHHEQFSPTRMRPQSAFEPEAGRGSLPKTTDSQTPHAKRGISPSPRRQLDEVCEDNITEGNENLVIEHMKENVKEEASKEMNALLEHNFTKYKQMKEALKLDNPIRLPRYQYNPKGGMAMPQVVSRDKSAEKKASTGDIGEVKVKNTSPINRGNEGVVTSNILDNFKVEKVLGQGSYATVRLVVDKKTGVSYALKTYNKVKLSDPQRKESVHKEIEILRSIDHPNVIKLYKSVDTPTQIYVVMELGGSISLQAYLKSKAQKKLSEHETKHIFRQLVEGIDYLHKNHIVHRDLKLENILLDKEKNVKIIDFGFSTTTAKNKPLNVCCGTPSYMAPELVARKSYFGHLVDIWALGVLLYVLLCGHFPFKGMTNKDLYNKIQRGQYVIPDNLSFDVKAILRKMLRMNPHERPSAKEILNDKWLTGEEESPANLKDFLTSKIEEYKNLRHSHKDLVEDL